LSFGCERPRSQDRIGGIPGCPRQRLRGEGGREGGDGHGEGEEAPALPRGGHVLPVAQPDHSRRGYFIREILYFPL